jgi:hypothetical protein
MRNKQLMTTVEEQGLRNRGLVTIVEGLSKMVGGQELRDKRRSLWVE